MVALLWTVDIPLEPGDYRIRLSENDVWEGLVRLHPGRTSITYLGTTRGPACSGLSFLVGNRVLWGPLA